MAVEKVMSHDAGLPRSCKSRNIVIDMKGGKDN